MEEDLIITRPDGTIHHVKPVNLWDPDGLDLSEMQPAVDIIEPVKEVIEVPVDLAEIDRRHKVAEWKQPCKKIKEESKKKRMMAARSRKKNRRK